MLFANNLANLAFPLEQFDLLNLGDWGFFSYSLLTSNTNAQFFLIFTFLMLGFFFQYNPNLSWIPEKHQRLSYILELFYQELMGIVFIFLVIAGLNLVGMIPFAFTITNDNYLLSLVPFFNNNKNFFFSFFV